MANPDAPQVMSLPLPPAQYFNLYTDESMRKNRIPKPPGPIQDTYLMFGNTYNNEEMIRSLESQGIRRLIPAHSDRRKELKKLNHSLFVNFLDLLDLLIDNPGNIKRIEKIEDLGLLFVHMHHLINEFRPHQAREALRIMMDVQKRSRIVTSRRFKQHLEQVRLVVKQAFSRLPEIPDAEVIRLDKVNNAGEISSTITCERTPGACEPLDHLMCDDMSIIKFEEVENL